MPVWTSEDVYGLPHIMKKQKFINFVFNIDISLSTHFNNVYFVISNVLPPKTYQKSGKTKKKLNLISFPFLLLHTTNKKLTHHSINTSILKPHQRPTDMKTNKHTQTDWRTDRPLRKEKGIPIINVLLQI